MLMIAVEALTGAGFVMEPRKAAYSVAIGDVVLPYFVTAVFAGYLVS